MYYLTKLYGNVISLPLLIPYHKSQIIREAAALIYFDGNVFAGVATWNAVICRQKLKERKRT